MEGSPNKIQTLRKMRKGLVSPCQTGRFECRVTFSMAQRLICVRHGIVGNAQ